ncbi:branched-chain amino acid transporter permease [Brachybacterium hainanense]|uniref:Branched-chain amino acid transporter permease n=1 Tax=Brachybacterium hainanense TaxID=1541174 RepID=A0ABV6RDN7_9MICO
MPETGYLIAVLAIGFAITFSLRAVPFLVLRPLRESRFVGAMSVWMPVGILAILAAATLRSSAGGDPGRILPAAVAVLVTVLAHLLGGRRTLLSVGLGTATYIVLVNVV